MNHLVLLLLLLSNQIAQFSQGVRFSFVFVASPSLFLPISSFLSLSLFLSTLFVLISPLSLSYGLTTTCNTDVFVYIAFFTYCLYIYSSFSIRLVNGRICRGPIVRLAYTERWNCVRFLGNINR